MKLSYQYESDRIYANDDAGKLIAEIDFPIVEGEIVDFNHTFVDPSLRGQGVGDQLVRAAIQKIKERGMKAVVTCSFVKDWFSKHPEEVDLLD